MGHTLGCREDQESWLCPTRMPLRVLWQGRDEEKVPGALDEQGQKELMKNVYTDHG